MSEIPLHTLNAAVETRRGAPHQNNEYTSQTPIQGYLAHKKQLPPRTLQQDFAWGPMAVLARGVGGFL